MNTATVLYKNAQHGVLDYFSLSRELIKGRYWLFFGITVVGILLGSLAPLGILMGPMMCGIFICFQKHIRNEEVKFEYLFQGFDYFLESFLATLIWLGFMLAISLPLVMFLMFNIGGMVYAFQQEALSFKLISAGLLVALILSGFLLFGFIGVSLQFAYFLIVERKLKAWGAVKTAFEACWANFFKMTGLGFTVILLSIAGTCCCYIGFFFLQPLISGAYFSAYRDVFEPPTPPPVPNA